MVGLKFRFGVLLAFSLCLGCVHEPAEVDDLVNIKYEPTAYALDLPANFPKLESPPNNALTNDGVNLGRHLFYDKILSANGTMSCSSCHLPEKGFTDGKAVSIGIDGIAGSRSSMSLINVGFTKSGLFWDGRIKTLEEQALLPVEDVIELHDSWPNVELKLRQHDKYPTLFRKAFGIKKSSEISKDLAAKALAQFQRILLSSNSKYDKILRNEASFTSLEFIGFQLYTDSEGDDLPDAECHHCHQLQLTTADDFFNNGLQESPDLFGFKDKGKGGFFNVKVDNGKFRAPTLRNIELSAPYMHDGSLQSLDDVLAHYNGGGVYSINKDPLIHPLELTQNQLKAIKAFLLTLTDTTYLKNPHIKSPF